MTTRTTFNCISTITVKELKTEKEKRQRRLTRAHIRNALVSILSRLKTPNSAVSSLIVPTFALTALAHTYV
jgi:hypothetical protein